MKKKRSFIPLSLLVDRGVTNRHKINGEMSRGRGTEMGASVQLSDEVESKNNFPTEDISNYPNKLSEEMVQTHEKYLSLSIWIIRHPSEGLQSSPLEHLSSSSFMSFSDSSTMTSAFRSPEGIHQTDAVDNQMSSFDPYGVSYKMNWGNVGSHNLAAEVSWMSVGKAICCC
ncbi:hypothetical protein MUK42_33200 [Musa troglodytarum]|uniref:Uncharacterized protein n=1 Tax=Musa troglodytarum TaxID=320322 RepID=A0A9E7FD74_9LILI|nr:hypothetical protein MUK42_33200 [Musa troglodytarum]